MGGGGYKIRKILAKESTYPEEIKNLSNLKPLLFEKPTTCIAINDLMQMHSANSAQNGVNEY